MLAGAVVVPSAAEPRFSVVALKVASGTGAAWAAPVSATLPEPWALLLTVNEPVKLPSAVAVKPSEKVHEAFGASVVPHPFVTVKGDVAVTLENTTSVLPVLVMVIERTIGAEPSV